MLGEQADLTEQIEQAESELENVEGLVKISNDKLREYETITNPSSPKFYINKITGVLRRDDGWAGRDSKARGLRQNSRVSDETYKKFIRVIPEKSRDELIITFNTKMASLIPLSPSAQMISIS